MVSGEHSHSPSLAYTNALSLLIPSPTPSFSLSLTRYSKVDPGLVLRVIPLLSYMMDDTSINVIKRLLVCVLHVYRLAFVVSQLFSIII